MDGVKWRWGRVQNEGREWPTFRLSQSLIDLKAPEYGLRERVILAGLIAWSQSLDGSPTEIALPKGYLAKLTGSHDNRSINEGIECLCDTPIIANAHNSDRRVGRQRRCAVIRRVSKDSVMFDDALAEHVLWPRQYAFVELATVAGLKSKYAAALYPLLCMQAGRAMTETHKFRFDVGLLKDILGHRGSFASFEREALTPAIRDIREYGHQYRFTIPDEEVGVVKGTGRGRPVIAVTMTLQVPVERLSAMDKVSLPVRRQMQGQTFRLPYTLPKPPPTSHEKLDHKDTLFVTASRHREAIPDADLILLDDMVDARIKAVPVVTTDGDDDVIPY
ncbi:MAG: replication initiation protein [Alphaproteobacteria bacterium]|nr:replication initiation protein [Alphaproteobacteria bacterium]